MEHTNIQHRVANVVTLTVITWPKEAELLLKWGNTLSLSPVGIYFLQRQNASFHWDRE